MAIQATQPNRIQRVAGVAASRSPAPHTTLPRPVGTALSCLVAFLAIGAGQCLAQDGDGDGIDDALEYMLGERFAPVYYTHSEEVYMPARPNWFMPRVHMRYEHSDCSDHQILDKGEVNIFTIGEQDHQNVVFPCNHSGEFLHSSGGPPGSSDSHYFLQIPDDSDELVTRQGIPDATQWSCFTHVQWSPAYPEHYDIQYIFFYAYNGDLGGLGGSHEGDWEHVTMRIGADQDTIQAIYFAAHNSEGRWYFPGEFEMEDGRPVVYSALDSHASYPDEGVHLRFPASDYTDKGTRKNFDFDTIPLGEYDSPASNQEWLRYNGTWGERGPFFNGPYGPAFQGWFAREETSNNPPPVQGETHYAIAEGETCNGDGTGDWECPWIDFTYAAQHMPAGESLRLRAGEYTATGPVSFSTEMTISSYGGVARISAQ